MDIYFLGWICSFLFMILSIILTIQKMTLSHKITALNKKHQSYVLKQIVDLRKICHNINTPLNSIMTVFEIFKLKLYGDLTYEYVNYAEGACEAINDLKNNLQDLQSYCDYYTEKQNISVKDIQNAVHINLENPYVLNN